MPHLVLLYTRNLELQTNVSVLCRALADTMLAQRDESGKAVFPPGGTRVLAYPTVHHAVGDDGTAGRAAGGSGDYAFLYLNLRMAKGRSAAVHQRVGEALVSTAKTHLAPVFDQSHLGMTLQIDEGGEVFDGRHSTLHPLFNKT
jgi:5-carboxymethyl-2-hydroxymuconate isomerase